jgi:hypothetical protein
MDVLTWVCVVLLVLCVLTLVVVVVVLLVFWYRELGVYENLDSEVYPAVTEAATVYEDEVFPQAWMWQTAVWLESVLGEDKVKLFLKTVEDRDTFTLDRFDENQVCFLTDHALIQDTGDGCGGYNLTVEGSWVVKFLKKIVEGNPNEQP